MKILKYAFLVNLVLICIPYHSFAVDSDQFDVPAIKQRASAGDITALFGLASMYYKGVGVPQSYAKAIEYLTKAADLKSKEAQFSLGSMYYEGKGVPKDPLKAMEYFQTAADQGDMQSQVNLGIIYREGILVHMNYPKAMEYFEKAAAQGSEQAKFNINFMKNSK